MPLIRALSEVEKNGSPESDLAGEGKDEFIIEDQYAIGAQDLSRQSIDWTGHAVFEAPYRCEASNKKFFVDWDFSSSVGLDAPQLGAKVINGLKGQGKKPAGQIGRAHV